MKFLLILVLLSNLRPSRLAQTSTTTQPQPTLHQVSLEQLLARPDQFDGQLVRLTGYLNLAYEAHALYCQPDDAHEHRSKNGLWVRFSAAITKQQVADYHQTYVVVVGTFDARSKGHLGLFGGTLKNISSLDKQPSTKQNKLVAFSSSTVCRFSNLSCFLTEAF